MGILRFLICIVLLGGPLCSLAQDRYLVTFADKPGEVADFSAFSAKALERRARLDIPFPMPEDLPVHAPYVAEVEALVVQLRHVLRWPNGVTVEANSQQISTVRHLPFVKAVEPLSPLLSLPADEGLVGANDLASPSPGDSLKMARLYRLQRQVVHIDSLREAGLTGKGVRIAVFDAGFTGVKTHPAFDSLWARGGVVDSKDFYRGKDPLRHSIHGTAVLGCITGWWNGKPLGAATDAEFLLARTEYGPTERLREQDAWAAAAEWADQQGADIISSSLGYSSPLHTYEEMDGRSTIVAQAAAMAVRKGILVVNSAGNQGDDKFHFVSSPGDVDSVLTVGASYPMLRYPMPFSSFGPNAAGVMKPDLAGPGYVISAGKGGGFDVFSGTSFACPTVAGMAACLMQRYPDKDNMEIRQLMVESAHLRPYYDYVLGHGVVDARRMLGRSRDSVAPTFALAFNADTLMVAFDPEVLGPDSTFNVNGKPFFFHVSDSTGHLLEYRFLRITKGLKQVGIPPERRPGGVLRIWFEGYLQEIDEAALRQIPRL